MTYSSRKNEIWRKYRLVWTKISAENIKGAHLIGISLSITALLSWSYRGNIAKFPDRDNTNVFSQKNDDEKTRNNAKWSVKC